MPTSTTSSTQSSPTTTKKAPQPLSRTASPKIQTSGHRAGSAVPSTVGAGGKGRSRTSTPTPVAAMVGQGKSGIKLENDGLKNEDENELGKRRKSGSPASRSVRAGSAVTVVVPGGNGAVKEKRDRRSSSKESGEGQGVPVVVMGKEREGSVDLARKSVDKDVAGDVGHLQPPQRAGGPTASTSGIPPPQAFPAILSRPPIRPPISSISKSKFDLEPNPFEQSFSRSSTSVHSHQTGSSSEDLRRETGRTRRDTGTGGMTTSKMPSPPAGKTALPPVSALTSPAALEPGPHFSWSGLSSSLRAGPLSPAMLTGPAGHHGLTNGPSALGANSASTGMTPQAGNGAFDPSIFRTGFTPGGGTGFTPGFGSMMGLGSMVNGMPAFPLPSPNTAAFLSMVTNNTPGAAGAGEGSNATSVVNGSQIGAANSTNGPPGGNQGSINGDVTQARPQTTSALNGTLPGGPNPSAMVDITPNTLNALTGVINQMDQEERQREETRRYSGQQQIHPAHLGPQGPPPPVQRPGQPELPIHPGAALMHHADSYFPHQPMGMQGGPGPHNGTGNPHQFHPGPMHNHGPPGPGGHPASHGTLPPSHLHQGGMRPGPMEYVHTDPNGHSLAPPGPDGPGPQGAVNGLFLLSQAHQELSKREEQEQHVEPPKPSGKKGGKGANKRKSSDAAAPTKSKPPVKKSKKAAPVEPPSPDFMNPMGDSDDEMMGDMNGYDDDDANRGDRKPETEEEKRKNFLERNRQAALKCRQRKKAWLGQLQTKVDGLSGENERLRSIIQNLTDEVGRISAVLSSHRDCPGMPASMAQLGISLPPPGMPGPPVMQGMMPPPGPGPASHAPPGSYRHNSAAPSNFGAQSQPQAV